MLLGERLLATFQVDGLAESKGEGLAVVKVERLGEGGGSKGEGLAVVKVERLGE